jgi:K+-sensing histidine kinase KdpD
MKNSGSLPSVELIATSFLAVLTVAATTIPLVLIGRDTLGEATIALLYLVPVTWSAYRWGQLPGISAALTAALAFDFLFVPPFYTFSVARLESWLMLVIFLAIAVLVVGRIQASITKARDATFMYELSAVLGGARTQDAVAHILTRHIQRLFQASLVRVVYWPKGLTSSITVSLPEDVRKDDPADRVLPVLNSWGLIGEIQIWRGLFGKIPPEESALLQNFTVQAARAFERTQNLETELSASNNSRQAIDHP